MNSFFGVDYYPEHWPESRWETDAQLMREMGIDAVRLGEFSWHKFEPREGEYHFEWMDRAIGVLAAHGIRVILGTPTAAPPAWMIQAYPEYLPMDANGVRRAFGGRHHDCQSSEGYRRSVRRLVTAMAEHYAGHPSVIAWQIDNELGNSHENLCFCPSCEKAFQAWLAQRYGTVDRLNEAWGTVFWSQSYNAFDEIPAPRLTPNVHNPSHVLAWRRFCSDLVLSFFDEQAEIIRRLCPGVPVTHNFMGFASKTDYFKLAERVDVVSDDRYPTGFYLPAEYGWARTPAAFDLTRGFKQQNFWVMEMQSGPSGTQMIGETPRPGELALWAATAVAHGADSVVWFRWRSCLFGPEQFWHGVLPHSGRPNRRYGELQRFIALMRPVLDDISGVYTPGEAAIVFDFNQWWALLEQPLHPQLDYIRTLCQWHEAFFRQNLAVDFCGPDADWSGYKLVVAPLMQLCGGERERKLREYVAGGGALVLGYRSAIKDEENVCRADGEPPCGLNDLAGGFVEDFSCHYRSAPVSLRWQDGRASEGTIWQDRLALTTAQTLAQAAGPDEAFAPAVTRSDACGGPVWYVGTELCSGDLSALVASMAERCGLHAAGVSPQGLEVRVRRGRKRDYLFALNASGEAQAFSPAGEWLPLDGEDSFSVPRFGVRLWYREKE